MNMNFCKRMCRSTSRSARLSLAAMSVWVFLSMFPREAEAAKRRPSFEEDYTILLREVMDNIDSMKNDLQIHEAQIGTFEERFKNLEEILDSLRQETLTGMQALKENLKHQSSTLDAKLSDQHNASKGLSLDVKSLATDNQQLIQDFKKRIAELEKSLDMQNRNIENLQAALSSVIEVIKGKEGSSEKNDAIASDSTPKTYRVKAGDSLEKIAKAHQTTIKKLKELNQLSGDQIIIGQKLKIPES